MVRRLLYKIRNQPRKANIQLFLVLGFIIGAFTLSRLLSSITPDVQSENREERALLVESVTVKSEKLPLTVNSTGSVTVRNYVNVIPEVSGRVEWVHAQFRDGGTFDTNDTLFRIEQADYTYTAQRLQADVEATRTALKLEKAEAEAANDEWQALNPGKPIPPLVARVPQLERAHAALKSAKAQLAAAKLDVARTKFSFPFAGRVVTATVAEGQFVSTGQNYGQVYPADALEVRVPIPDRLLQWFGGENNKAEIHTRYRGKDVTLQGAITQISSTLDEQTRFAYLVIQPAGEGWKQLLPGVFADITLTGPEVENIWRIPNAALQENQRVWIIGDENRITAYFPEVLTIGDEFTLVRGNGETVQLISGMIEGASDGLKVRVKEDENG